jgi:undecaprenyl-diphosphatase
MNILLRPIFVASLILTFVIAAWVGGPGSGAEPALMQLLTELRADWPQLTQAARLLTRLGGAPVTLTVGGVAALFLLLKRAPGAALLLAVTVLGERLLVDGLKDWIGRPRPPLDAILAQSLAFPSGHSANSMTAFLAAALIASPRAYRTAVASVALVLAILIGLTRIWLGVHWPSDVIGGWALGLLAVATALAIGQRSGALSLEAQHDIIGRHGTAPGENEVA